VFRTLILRCTALKKMGETHSSRPFDVERVSSHSLVVCAVRSFRAIAKIYGIVTVIWFDGTLSTPLESTDFIT
jgi:hypothetical protein